jgi:hypothetical protein
VSDRELNDAYGLITDLRTKIVGLEAEAAGRALMDAEGEAFLPEVVTQLQEELREAENGRVGLAECFVAYMVGNGVAEVAARARVAPFLANRT